MENPSIGLALLAGFLSFVSPCVLPLVPAYIGYMGARVTRSVSLQVAMVGNNASEAPKTRYSRLGMLMHGLSFVLGFSAIFILIGLMTTAFVGVLGSAVTTLTDIIGRVGGVIIIFFGLHFMGAIPALFRRLRQNSALLNSVALTLIIGILISMLVIWGFVDLLLALPILAMLWLGLALGGAFQQPATYWNKVMTSIETMFYSDTRQDMDTSGRSGLSGSFIMGVVFSAGWTPCIGPLLGTILTIAAQTGDAAQAIPLLGAYSLGLGIPFIATALLVDQAQGLLRKLQRHMHKIELASGTLLVIIGLLVASGQLQALSTNLTTNADLADLSTRIEECGVGYFEGHVYFNQIGSCLSGSLVPLAMGQSARGVTFTSDSAPLEYIFQTHEDIELYVELRDFETEIPPVVALLDPEGNEISVSTTGIRFRENRFLVMDGISINEDGIYTVKVTPNDQWEADASVRFRIRFDTVRPEIEVSSANDNIQLVTSQPADNADNGLNTFEDFTATSGPVRGLEIGNLAPDFALTTLEGKTLSLSDLRGQVVLLNFWGTWCGPCRREMPEFQNTYVQQVESDFEILAVAVRDTESKVLEFRAEFGLTFPIALDNKEQINDLYAVRTQPSTFIIDQDGVIIAKHFGMMVEAQIKELVTKALS